MRSSTHSAVACPLVRPPLARRGAAHASSVTPFPLRTRALPHAGVRCTAESGQKAKTALDAAHEEALVLMKDAEELLGKGEMQEAQAQFQSALER